MSAGEPIANYAIGSFALSRESFGAAALHARVTVANFSPSAATLRVTITGDGKAVGACAGDSRTRCRQRRSNCRIWRRLQVYRAQLEPSDGFMLDNVAYATGSAVQAMAVLFVSPTPADGASLASIPGVSVETRTPASYAPKDLANYDLAIFEYTVPKELPTVNTLLVMPPPGDPVFQFAAQASAAGRGHRMADRPIR